MDDRHLRWVRRNAGRARSPALVGSVARDVLASPRIRGPAWRRRLLAILEEHAGDALLEHAWPVHARCGVLTFEVAEPAALYHVRVAWEQCLLRLIQAQVPGAGIHTIRFVPACASVEDARDSVARGNRDQQ